MGTDGAQKALRDAVQACETACHQTIDQAIVGLHTSVKDVLSRLASYQTCLDDWVKGWGDSATPTDSPGMTKILCQMREFQDEIQSVFFR